jgi:hypothetical protein
MTDQGVICNYFDDMRHRLTLPTTKGGFDVIPCPREDIIVRN